MMEVIFNFINSTVSKKSIQHDNFMHIFPLSIFQGGGQLPPLCPCLRAPMEVSKTTVIYVKFLHDVACQKLLTSANMFHGVIQKITLAQFF